MSANSLVQPLRLVPSSQYVANEQRCNLKHMFSSPPPPPPPSFETSNLSIPSTSKLEVVASEPRVATTTIATPSSTRAHTPSVQLLPLPTSLSNPCCPIRNCPPSAKKRKVWVKTELEPVDLKPIVPRKRSASPRAMAVVDDDEEEGPDGGEASMHVARRNRFRYDDGMRTIDPHPDDNPLPTPLATPRLGSCPDGPAVFKVPYTTSLRHCSPETDGPRRHSNTVERGRTRERGPSRFRGEKERHHRPALHDKYSESFESEISSWLERSRKLLVERFGGKQAPTICVSIMQPSQQQKDTPAPAQQPPPASYNSPSPAIFVGVDEVANLFANEARAHFARHWEQMQQHFSGERAQLHLLVGQERQSLERAKAEVLSEREQLQKECQAMREENAMLKLTVAQLQAALDVYQQGQGQTNQLDFS